MWTVFYLGNSEISNTEIFEIQIENMYFTQ